MSLFIIYLHTCPPQAGYIRVKETHGLEVQRTPECCCQPEGWLDLKSLNRPSLAVPLPDLNNNNLLVTLVGTARFRFGSALY